MSFVDKECRQVIINPRKFVEYLGNKKQICYGEMILVVLLAIIYQATIVKSINQCVLVNPVISICLFSVLQYGIFKIGRGKCQFRVVFNLWTYLHLLVIVGSFFAKVPIVSVLMLLGVQLLGIYYQYLTGIYVAKVKKKYMIWICSAQVMLALLWVTYQLLTYLGRYVVYREKTRFFPLIVR